MTIKEEGFIEKVKIPENANVEKGDTIMVLDNKQLYLEEKKSLNKISIIKLELEDILKSKKYTSNLNFYDINRIQEEINYLNERKEIIEDQLKNKNELFKQKLVSSEEYEEKKLELNSVQAQLTKVTLEKNDLKKRIKDLDQLGVIKYNLKKEELLNEELSLERIKRRIKDLIIIAPRKGKVIFKDYRTLLNSFKQRGESFGNLISFDEIDFYGMARNGDVIRLKPEQKCFFNIEYLRGKEIIEGRVKEVGLFPVEKNQSFFFPILIEADQREFVLKNETYSLKAGITGEAVIITEENVTIFNLITEKFKKSLNIN